MEEGETKLLVQEKERQRKSSLITMEEDSYHEATTELNLKGFKSGIIAWIFIDQSNLWKQGFSWSVFFLLAIAVPIVSHFAFSCSDCDQDHQRPFDAIVQLSLSIFATLSFVSLSSFSRKYGLRKFLFLDKLYDESHRVQQAYTFQLHVSTQKFPFFSLSLFSFPFFFSVKNLGKFSLLPCLIITFQF